MPEDRDYYAKNETMCQCLSCHKIFRYSDRYIPKGGFYYEGKCPHCRHTFTFLTLKNREDLHYVNGIGSSPRKKD